MDSARLVSVAKARLRRIWVRTSNPPLFAARPRVPTHANAAIVHAFTRRRILEERSGIQRIGLALEWLVWYASVPIRVLINTSANGSTIQRRTRKSSFRQALEQLDLAWRASIPPRTYYRFRLYEPESRARAGDYVHRFETKKSLYRYLRPETGVDGMLLNDKLEFARECQRHGVRTVPVWMEFNDRQASAVEAETLPPEDLIVKPKGGRGGRHVERWRHLEDDRYESSAGQVLDRDALLQHLCEQSRSQPFIVQPRLLNHSAIADLSRGVLMTVRALTCMNEDGDGEVTNASFRIGGSDPVVDNMHRGGIAAAVDLATGRLGHAIGLDSTADWLFEHPVSGVAIAGRVLPLWDEAVELACRAHRVFSQFVVIGWDVALLEDGPCLVEGNRSPCVNLLQRPLGGPLGSGRFGELVAHQIARIEAARG